MRTYSRQRTYGRNAAEPPVKRRRILEPDASDAIFHSDAVAATDAPFSPVPDGLTGAGTSSDNGFPASTPPSSPPPALPPVRRPTFSFFARRTAKAPAATSALRERSPNNSPSPSSSPKKPSNPAVSSTKPTTAATTPSSPPQPQKKTPNPKPKAKGKPPRRMTQLRLDLSLHTPVSAQKTCSACGMAYVPSNDEDAALHKAFHAMSDGGVELGRAFVRGLPDAQVVWRGGDGEDKIVLVGRRDGVAARNRVLRVMEVVRSELGAVEIGEGELWGAFGERVEDKNGVKAEKSAGKGKESATAQEDRFRTFLYVRGSKCIGLCLAERIEEAYRVLPDAPAPAPAPATEQQIPTQQQQQHDQQEEEQRRSTSPTSSLSPKEKAQASPTARPAPSAAPAPQTTPAPSTTNNFNLSPTPSNAYNIGISRIWTSSCHRRGGVARALLDAVVARRGVEDGGWGGNGSDEVRSRGSKEGIAFSQPTEAGGRLAREWFGEVEWGVYW